MAEIVKKITDIIEALAPKTFAETWDSVGLQIGSPKAKVDRIMICLDITEKVMEEAIEKKVGLIISHHPFLFKPLKNILQDDHKGKVVYQAIQNNINLYSAHTNIDVVKGGLNDQLTLMLGLTEIQMLQVTNQQEYFKLVVFVPVDQADQVADALGESGAGHIGNYSHCSFRSSGTGTFIPLDGTTPYIGSQGKMEKVEEIRLETIIKKENLKETIESMLKAHPYEAVAYDLYPIANTQPTSGIGRIGKLENPLHCGIFIEEIKAILGIDKVKFTGDVNALIEKVAVVNGSGADYMFDAIKAKCDCLITGDMKYHEAQIALDYGLNIIDAGHFETEILFVNWMQEYLTEGCRKKGLDVEVIASQTFINPFQYF